MSQGDHPDAARALLDAADSAAMLASEAGALDTVGIEAQCRSEAALMVRSAAAGRMPLLAPAVHIGVWSLQLQLSSCACEES